MSSKREVWILETKFRRRWIVLHLEAFAGRRGEVEARVELKAERRRLRGIGCRDRLRLARYVPAGSSRIK